MLRKLTLVGIFALALPSFALADGDGAVKGAVGGAVAGAVVGGPVGAAVGGAVTGPAQPVIVAAAMQHTDDHDDGQQHRR
jgi:hypothetical protein